MTNLKDQFRTSYLGNGHNAAAASREVGVPERTACYWAAQMAAAGELGNVPGRIDPGFAIKGRSQLYDGEGNLKLDWVKTDRQKQQLADDIDTIKECLQDIEPFTWKVPAPTDTDTSTLAFYPLADLHIGLLAWGMETGEDWDIKIANTRYRDVMARVAEDTPSSSKAVILGGGDLLHADNFQAKSERSGHSFDVEGRWPKMVKAGIELLVFQIGLALAKHDEVEVKIMRGNHDDKGAIVVAMSLYYKYLEEPRVTVVTDFDLFWYRRFGSTMLAATHGHEAKLTDMPLIMACREVDMWAATKHRYCHGFHIHNKTQHVWENGGVIGETHQSPAAQDAWTYNKGFLSGRSMMSITYHETQGEWGRTPRMVLA